MKIKSIRAVAVDLNVPPKTPPRVPQQKTNGFIAPMSRYPEFGRGEWGTGL